jgi:pilus assembly protein CpaB
VGAGAEGAGSGHIRVGAHCDGSRRDGETKEGTPNDMGRRTLLLIASILVAALGTSLLWLYVQGAESRAQEGQALVPALFLRSDAPADTKAENLQSVVVQKNVPADVAEGAVTSLAQVQGTVLRDNAVGGQLLLRSMFGTVSSGVGSQRAFVSISIADPDRTPAMLKVGDEVAVYARTNRGSGTPTTQLVAPRVKVMSLGSSTQAGTNGATVAVTIVGFDVDPQTGVDLIDIPNYGTPVLELLGRNAEAPPGPKR